MRTTGIAVLAATTLAVAACGGSGGGDERSIVISGSSTVQPISVAVGDAFPGDADITVDGPGTGDGFQLFCAGEIDIADASRPIHADDPEEGGICEENGIGYVELRIGIDGLTVMTSAANPDPPACLAFADLYALVGPESEGFDSWSDADALAAEVGAPNAPYPDRPLDVAGPGEESGTYDSFVEIALKGIAESRVEAGALEEDLAGSTRADYDASSDDNQIVAAVEGSESSLGWVGFGVAESAGDGIREVPVSDGESDCVAPTPDTIRSGDYPLSRSLYLYVNLASAAEKPVVAEFVDYYLGDGLSAVEASGYVALSEEDVAATRQAWEDRATGAREG
ncbi:MAG TPA: substrate-binding domain-containing protein [Acidimicrobiales bacterium]